MYYSIGEVSKMFSLPISTLRFYDKKGLFLNIERNDAGVRRFSEDSVELLRVIECLKKAGMSLDEIKVFIDLIKDGDASINKRRDMFYQRKKEVEAQLEELNNVLDFIKFKCWYYDTASQDKTEKNVKAMIPDSLPKEMKSIYDKTH